MPGKSATKPAQTYFRFVAVFFKCQTIFLLIFATGFFVTLRVPGTEKQSCRNSAFFHAKLFLCLGLRVIGRHVADFIVQPGRQPNANTRQGLSRFELLRRPQKIACHCQSDFDGKRRQTRLEEMNVYDDNSPSSCTNHFFYSDQTNPWQPFVICVSSISNWRPVWSQALTFGNQLIFSLSHS